MIMWKRKVGQSVVIGSDVLVTVKRVCDAGGRVLKGVESSLGFVTPEGVRVQRAEKYTKDLQENLEFPRFYKMLKRSSGRVHGYSLSLPAEVDLRSDGYDYAPVDGFEDMKENDPKVELHIFRSEAEAIAFSQGVALSDEDAKLGTAIGRQGNIWLVLVHFYYEEYPSGFKNPQIRDHLGRSERLQEALREAS
jgi:sRNA-binding carbon storage regulator CsrA